MRGRGLPCPPWLQNERFLFMAAPSRCLRRADASHERRGVAAGTCARLNRIVISESAALFIHLPQMRRALMGPSAEYPFMRCQFSTAVAGRASVLCCVCFGRCAHASRNIGHRQPARPPRSLPPAQEQPAAARRRPAKKAACHGRLRRCRGSRRLRKRSLSSRRTSPPPSRRSRPPRTPACYRAGQARGGRREAGRDRRQARRRRAGPPPPMRPRPLRRTSPPPSRRCRPPRTPSLPPSSRHRRS